MFVRPGAQEHSGSDLEYEEHTKDTFFTQVQAAMRRNTLRPACLAILVEETEITMVDLLVPGADGRMNWLGVGGSPWMSL